MFAYKWTMLTTIQNKVLLSYPSTERFFCWSNTIYIETGSKQPGENRLDFFLFWVKSSFALLTAAAAAAKINVHLSCVNFVSNKMWIIWPFLLKWQKYSCNLQEVTNTQAMNRIISSSKNRLFSILLYSIMLKFAFSTIGTRNFLYKTTT